MLRIRTFITGSSTLVTCVPNGDSPRRPFAAEPGVDAIAVYGFVEIDFMPCSSQGSALLTASRWPNAWSRSCTGVVDMGGMGASSLVTALQLIRSICALSCAGARSVRAAVPVVRPIMLTQRLDVLQWM